MSFRELFTSPPLAFLLAERKFEEADWCFLGVPLDLTSTFRPGSRLGPLEIRRASIGLEVVGLYSGVGLDELSIHDMGDLHLTYDVEEDIRRLGLVAAEVLGAGKSLLVAGGEHTITLGVVSGLVEALGMPKVVCLDAHLDMRDEFSGWRICHATVCRRLAELLGPGRLALVGVRAASREGLRFAEEKGIKMITASEVEELGPGGVLEALSDLLELDGPLHVSLDLDVLDPAFAPAVQPPAPFGLTPRQVMDIPAGLCRLGPRSLDVAELTSGYDHGQTAILAARLMAEALCIASSGASGSHQA